MALLAHRFPCAICVLFAVAHAFETSELFLPDDQRDGCLKLVSAKEKSECFQEIFEAYYSNIFTIVCPNMGLNMAIWKCEGCPWDKVDPEKFSLQKARESNYSELFHTGSITCSVAHFARRFQFLKTSRLYNLQRNLMGIVLSTFANILALYSDDYRSPKTPTVLGWLLPEPLFIGLTIVIFYTGLALSGSTRAFLEVCELPHTESGPTVVYQVNLIVMFFSLMWRFLHLKTKDANHYTQSWAVYSAVLRDDSSWKARLARFLCGGGPIFLGVLIVLESFGAVFTTGDNLTKSNCLFGHRSSPFGLIIYSGLVLTLLTSVLYSFGPPQDRIWFFLRFCTLCIIFLLATVLIGIRSSSFLHVKTRTMLLPPVPDDTVDSGLVGYFHICYTAALGIAEPTRFHPRKPRPYFVSQNDNNDTEQNDLEGEISVFVPSFKMYFSRV